MTKTIYLALATIGFLAASPQTSTTPAPASVKPTVAKPVRTAKSKKATTAKPTPAMTIPAGAVKTPEGAYRYTDANGNHWLYRDTPFGVSRVPETEKTAAGANAVATPFGTAKVDPTPAPVAMKPADDPSARVTASSRGETIQFQKTTPFGTTSWQKNKNALTPEEQKIWEREQAKATR